MDTKNFTIIEADKNNLKKTDNFESDFSQFLQEDPILDKLDTDFDPQLNQNTNKYNKSDFESDLDENEEEN
ncbi:MAG: hypothetical protein MJ188_04250 [Treponema sp.]|nr:hypothetical protein [Treponema sp.]